MNRLAVWLGALAFSLIGAVCAQAGVIASGTFPEVGDLYHSATNGDGSFTAGGQSAYMWTTGDYVASNGYTLPPGSYLATSLSNTFQINNVLGNGNSLLVDAYLDGNLIGSWTATDCGYCGTIETIVFNTNFAPILMSGPFTIEYELANTIPGGGGSIAILQGGQGSISGTVLNSVPEPITVSLFGAGLAGTIAMRRRKKKAA